MEDSKNIWLTYDAEEKKELDDLAERYEDFLSQCKTERESVKRAVADAEKAGYKNLIDIIKSDSSIKTGDKVIIDTETGKYVSRA